MNASATPNEGERRKARPQKGKRVVVRKYARHACAQCKKARAKCEGGEPVCERCQRTGHECNWSLEDARRPLTRAHEQALKHQNALLRAEVEHLSREIAALRLCLSEGSGNSNPPSIADFPSLGHESVAAAETSAARDEPITAASSNPSGTLALGTSLVPDASSTEPESTPLWGLVPVEDIASDAQGDLDAAASDSDDDVRRQDSEFDCDVESNYDSDEGSEDSDVDVDKALIAPTKTLFTEQDDLHHYGLTSVFRLRRRASHRNVQARPHGENESAASDYDSSSSYGTRPSRTRHKSLRSFLSSSSANETGTRTDTSQRINSPKRDREGNRRQKVSRARGNSPIRTQQHILLVGDLEDAWKGCDCQSDCWNRWLPKGVPLSRREHDVLLERVFLFFTAWCMRAIPEYFLRDMYTFLHPTLSLSTAPFARRSATSLPRLAHYSPFLHNMILAVGSAFSSDPNIRKSETRSRFADEGKAYIEEECSRPNISTVQALGLLASYYSGQGQQTLGFMYFGMAARIAQALGLFADCTPLLRAGRLCPPQVFDRTWCFHMAAAQDACWSMYVGRECGIPLPPAKKQDQMKDPGTSRASGAGNSTRHAILNEPPIIAMDDPFCLKTISVGGTAERLDTMAWRRRGARTENTGDDVPQCKTFTAFQWSCQLMKIGRSIMDLMNCLVSSDSGTEIKLFVADIDIQLDAWRQDLPAELRLTPANESSALPHKLMMHSAFWWQHILLHRPFYNRHRAKSMDSSFSVARCNVAAREILCILRLWRKIYGTVRYCPITLIQTIFAAGTICILQAMQASTGKRPATQSQATALTNLEELVGYLRECSESWECAIRIADIFDKLLKEQRKAMEGINKGIRAKNSRKKRRRLEMLKDTETAVHAAQSALLNRIPFSSDVRTDDSCGGGSEMSSPAVQVLDNSTLPQIVISPAGTHQPLFSPLHQSIADVSVVFNSPVINATNPSRHHAHTTISLTNDCTTHLPGAHVPSYPTGYFSDESYTSDAPYFSTDDLDLDIPMSASTNDPTNCSPFDSDFNFLLNSNSDVNMDAVMPGMSMFDTTSLPGLALGPVTTDGVTFGNAHCGSYSSETIAFVTSPDLLYGAPPGVDADMQAEWNLTSDGEDDRALLDILAALNGNQLV